MRASHTQRSRGFVLIEALIALLIVSVGLLAISKLEGLTISAAGEARSRSEAVTLAQKKLEQLRNWVVESAFINGMVDGSDSYTGSNASYNYAWTITGSAGGSLVQLTTTWTDRFNTQQRLDLNSLVSWDDPYNQLKGEAGFTGMSAPSPSGQAKRGTSDMDHSGGPPQGSVQNSDGSGTYTYTQPDNTVELLSSTGEVILYLPPMANGQAQSFTTISGRIYFDQNAGNNAIPNSNNVRVRLSSEGQCFYNNAVNALSSTINAGSNSYKYFAYVCYVGPEWWGNVGVVVDDSVNGQAGNPTLCVGDPAFNGGVSDGTLIAANPVESSVRSYRGFYNASGTYLTTGMQGGTNYPYDVINSNITGRGSPLPASYQSYYPGVNAGDATNYFNQHFLITHISGQDSCYAKMLGGEFTRNSGQYFCISPDFDSAHSDACPSIWPGFENAVGSGGQINYLLSAAKAGSGTGTVTSSPTGISCDANCTTTQNASYASGTSVTLTATAASGSTFAGWSGDCSGTGTCTVSMTQARTVTATFNTGATNYTLSVAVSGSGTVTGSSGAISCPGTCSDLYASGSSVTLTASLPATGYGFLWGGACSGSSNTCAVTMDAAKSVTATYYQQVPYDLTVTKNAAAGGTVSSSPSGITCGTGCTTTTTSFSSGTSVTLTASAASGYVFTSWSGACSGSGATCTVTMSAAQSVTANFSVNCSATITGTAHDKFGNVTLVTPSGGGSCAMNGGNSAGYSCTVTAVQNSTVVLNNARTTGNVSDQYTYDLSIPWTCNNITNGNFPQ